MSYQDHIVNAGADSYWPLDESSGPAIDRIGNADLDRVGPISADSIRPGSAGSQEFDGVDDEFEAIDAMAAHGSSYSVVAWMRTTLNDTTGVVGWGGAGSPPSGMIHRPHNLEVRVQTHDGHRITVEVPEAGLDELIHFVYTLESDGASNLCRMYVNGVEEGSFVANASASSLGSSGFLRIGWASGDYYGGRISDVAVYPRTLSAQEVEDDYQSGLNDDVSGVDKSVWTSIQTTSTQSVSSESFTDGSDIITVNTDVEASSWSLQESTQTGVLEEKSIWSSSTTASTTVQRDLSLWTGSSSIQTEGLLEVSAWSSQHSTTTAVDSELSAWSGDSTAQTIDSILKGVFYPANVGFKVFFSGKSPDNKFRGQFGFVSELSGTRHIISVEDDNILVIEDEGQEIYIHDWQVIRA